MASEHSRQRLKKKRKKTLLLWNKRSKVDFTVGNLNIFCQLLLLHVHLHYNLLCSKMCPDESVRFHKCYIFLSFLWLIVPLYVFLSADPLFGHKTTPAVCYHSNCNEYWHFVFRRPPSWKFSGVPFVCHSCRGILLRRNAKSTFLFKQEIFQRKKVSLFAWNTALCVFLVMNFTWRFLC